MYKNLIALLVIISSSPSQAEIYKWVDEQGRTHYGDKSVENSKEMDVQTQKSGNIKQVESREDRRKKLIDAFNEDRARKNEEKAKKKKAKKEHDRKCVIARDNLKSYERAGYIYDLDKDGNKIIATNEQRKKLTDDLRKNIKKYCK